MAESRQNVIIAAFTEEETARLTGVSQRQLRYWASDDFFAPTIKTDDPAFPQVRLYNFRDLVCLKVLSTLRNEAKISFPELRRTKARLSHLGEDMWVKTTLYILGKRVVFDNPETGNREDMAGQGVLQIPLKVVTGKMEEAVRTMRERKSDAIGKITQKRGVAQNQPVIAGTKIPVRSIQTFHKAGYTNEQIREQYPTLTAEDIEAAIRYKNVA
ncbi:MAG TPA: DUF433 domain-containing protein [Beijerinckiaceae bacterium]|nr:DUF433 domain-containing protein [Beijerinckiaceae bacterium]